MSRKSKVTERLGKPKTTIDQKSGDAYVTRKGVFKGFGEGFRDYVMKGNVTQNIGGEVKVGQYPAGHEQEGKWAIQIPLSPFDSQELANDYSDRVVSIIEGILGVKALTTQ